MHMLRGFLLVPSLLALIGCGPQIRTQADFDPEIDYSSYDTFAWISEHPMVIATSPAPTLSPFLA